MEDKEQKIKQLIKDIPLLKRGAEEILKRIFVLEERIRHLEEIEKRVGVSVCSDKTFPDTLQIAKFELKELTQQRLKLISLWLNKEEELKNLLKET